MSIQVYVCIHRYQVRRPISSYLWEFLSSAAGQHLGVFQQSGGSLDFYDGCLHIQAHTAEAAEEFSRFIVDQFTECPIPLTVKQWNQLMELRSDASSQFIELAAPFSTNPNVKIWPTQGQEVGGPAIIFTGKKDAVFSAHTHFMSAVSKEMEISR